MPIHFFHKWETVERYETEIYWEDETDTPTGRRITILQRCTICGKETVRRHRM